MGTTSTPIWEPARNNWSTTRSAVFHTDHPERFSEREQANLAPGGQGWVTDPPNGLSPDCEPVGGVCGCGRQA
jgi:hypothetical protein